MRRLLSVTNGRLLAVHCIASQESFVYFSSAAIAAVRILVLGDSSRSKTGAELCKFVVPKLTFRSGKSVN